MRLRISQVLGYRHKVWIIGDGRSGTTWLMESLNRQLGYRMLFEPMHPQVMGFRMQGHFYPFCASNQAASWLQALTDEIFTGKVRHPAVDAKRHFTLRNRGLLVKDIFAHLYAGWACNYYTDLQTIVILRHPIDVALSKMERLDWKWPKDPRDFMQQKELVQAHLAHFTDRIARTTDQFQRFILNWAILHNVLLKTLPDARVRIVHYEDLLSDPQDGFGRLCTFLGAPRVPDGFAEQIGRRKPSKTITRNWSDRVTESQQTEAMEILAEFGLDHLYGPQRAPLATSPYVVSN